VASEGRRSQPAFEELGNCLIDDDVGEPVALGIHACPSRLIFPVENYERLCCNGFGSICVGLAERRGGVAELRIGHT
jgi:hypothetical protein